LLVLRTPCSSLAGRCRNVRPRDSLAVPEGLNASLKSVSLRQLTRAIAGLETEGEYRCDRQN
jgi:hypothetical protein